MGKQVLTMSENRPPRLSVCPRFLSAPRALRLLAFLVAHAAAATSWAAVTTSMQVTSEAGDWVGQGDPYSFTMADGAFTVTRFEDGGVAVDFATPDLSAFWH